MNAIHRGMKDYNVDSDERILFSQNVRLIARTIINAQHEEAEIERQRSKKAR